MIIPIRLSDCRLQKYCSRHFKACEWIALVQGKMYDKIIQMFLTINRYISLYANLGFGIFCDVFTVKLLIIAPHSSHAKYDGPLSEIKASQYYTGYSVSILSHTQDGIGRIYIENHACGIKLQYLTR